MKLTLMQRIHIVYIFFDLFYSIIIAQIELLTLWRPNK